MRFGRRVIRSQEQVLTIGWLRLELLLAGTEICGALLLARGEQELLAPYREWLAWAVDALGQYGSGRPELLRKTVDRINSPELHEALDRLQAEGAPQPAHLMAPGLEDAFWADRVALAAHARGVENLHIEPLNPAEVFAMVGGVELLATLEDALTMLAFGRLEGAQLDLSAAEVHRQLLVTREDEVWNFLTR